MRKGEKEIERPTVSCHGMTSGQVLDPERVQQCAACSWRRVARPDSERQNQQDKRPGSGGGATEQTRCVVEWRRQRWEIRIGKVVFPMGLRCAVLSWGGSGMHSAERLHVPVVLAAELLTGAEASQHRRRRWRAHPESSRERSVKPAGQQREVLVVGQGHWTHGGGRAVEAKTQGPALAGEGGQRWLHMRYLLAAVGLRKGCWSVHRRSGRPLSETHPMDRRTVKSGKKRNPP
jgi:hypothetical protein